MKPYIDLDIELDEDFLNQKNLICQKNESNIAIMEQYICLSNKANLASLYDIAKLFNEDGTITFSTLTDSN